MSPDIFWLLFGIEITLAHASRILALFPDISRSHTTANRPLFRTLAARGHHVTFLTGYPDRDAEPLENYQEIAIEGLREHVETHIDFLTMTSTNPLGAMLNGFKFGHVFARAAEVSLFSNATQSLLRSGAKFDLIFVDLTHADVYLRFVHKFDNPPFVGVAPFGSILIGDLHAGNAASPSYVPSTFLPLTDRMGFFDRLVNFVDFAIRYAYHVRHTSRMVQDCFGVGYPTSQEIAQNMSLLMVRTDIAHDFPRPLSPMTIEVGGMHLQPAKQLPQDLEDWITSSDSDVIYFSLGSLVRSDRISAGAQAAILDAFRALPVRVLWKWESDSLAGLPPNVMLRKWLPQNDLLGHPRVKLFVTQGGVNSLDEAIYHRVPIIAIPVFGDQFFQANKIVTHGIGKKLDYATLTKDCLRAAILEVLTNSSYRANIAHIHRVSRDKIQTALQSAVFWTEYVLRHGGGQHLRPSAASMPWFRFLLLDVLTALLVIVGGVVCLAIYAHRMLSRLVLPQRMGWKATRRRADCQGAFHKTC